MLHHKFVILAALTLHVAVSAQQAPIGYDDTPMQPNNTWRVHDGTRPYPAVVTPALKAAPPRIRPMPSCCSVREATSPRGRWPTDRRQPGR